VVFIHIPHIQHLPPNTGLSLLDLPPGHSFTRNLLSLSTMAPQRLSYSLPNEPPISTHMDLSYSLFALMLLFVCLLLVFVEMIVDNDLTKGSFLFSVYSVLSAFQQC
jgi:hypothetical protein